LNVLNIHLLKFLFIFFAVLFHSWPKLLLSSSLCKTVALTQEGERGGM